jgi:hypothetical protein
MEPDEEVATVDLNPMCTVPAIAGKREISWELEERNAN